MLVHDLSRWLDVWMDVDESRFYRNKYEEERREDGNYRIRVAFMVAYF